MRATFEELSVLWDEGVRELAAAEPRRRAVLERIVDALVYELRRRVGGNFTVDELARHYLDEGIEWGFEIATRIAPDHPEAWDLPVVAGAAYARYVRQASDFGGGRRRISDEDA